MIFSNQSSVETNTQNTDGTCSKIHEFFEIADQMKVKENCHIGVGYSLCTDILFRAKDLFKVYESMFDWSTISPQNHKEINTHQEFIETFLYFSEKGAATERVAMNDTLHIEMRHMLTSHNIPHDKELGGHAVRFAERAILENCKVFFPGLFSNYAVEQMKTFGVNALDIPNPSHIDESLEDIHFCILYSEGEEFFGHKAGRSNRFYLITDPIGKNLTFIEFYHEELNQMNKDKLEVKDHLLAGLQYMEAMTQQEVRARFDKMRDEWRKIKEDNKEHTIHIELAHFNFFYSKHYIISRLFNYADSVGFNEQEIVALFEQLLYYEEKTMSDIDDLKDFYPAKSKIGPYESLNLIAYLINNYFEPTYKNVTRIQYHTLGTMATCYDPNVWESGDMSLFRYSFEFYSFDLLYME